MTTKTVLITGCSSGIGRALCEEFHARGHRVVATARRIETLDALKSRGMGVEELDVTEDRQVSQVIAEVLHREGRIDILVNNAGYGLMGPMLDLPDSEVLMQFQTNEFGPLGLIRAVAPSMRARGGGLIVNIGSISGIVTTPFAGAYCASKASVHSISEALRMELAPFGIRVVTVQPGGIRSNFGNASLTAAQRAMRTESWYASIRKSIDKRAMESQSNATPAHQFARRLVDIVVSKRVPPVVRLGSKSFSLPFLKKALPTVILDSIFRKRYGLFDERNSPDPMFNNSQEVV
jgi:NAD(P)-dependent dehydrogenase (short-subunit alcohol dehydrogenase family)